RRRHVSANIGGRIDSLDAEFAGDVVEEGQALYELYSPELIAVQEELLQAVATLETAPQERRESAAEAGSAVRRRLKLAGITEEQMDALIEAGQVEDQTTFHAPFGGVVISRNFEEGDYIPREGRLLSLADYDTLWVNLEAYDSDLPWLSVG